MTRPSDEGQVRVCPDEGPAPDEGRIVVCDEPDEPSDGKIRVCPPEGTGDEDEESGPDPCEGAGAPSIVSPAASSVVTGDPGTGTVIQVSGGTQPYSVNYSAGTVSQISATQWRITSLDSCGTSGDPAWGTITVTDYCGNKATRDVRNTGGKWCCLQPISTPCPANVRYDCYADWTGDGSGGTRCKNSGGYDCYINGYQYILGGYRYTENITCWNGRTPASTPLDGSNPCQGYCATNPCAVANTVARWIQEWVCP